MTTPTTLAGLKIRNTAKLITADTRICSLLHSPGGFGKTTAGASMDAMTKKFFGKPTIYIACDPGEGGGTMSIQDFGVDFVVPTSLEDLRKIIASLHTDTCYAGVVLDPANEYVNRFVKAYALKFPSREHVATRTAGVPERSDYQTMGEIARQDLNSLINLTTHSDLNIRKHLLVNCTQKDKMDNGTLTSIQPDLPGALAGTATAMFQTVLSMKIEVKVVKNDKGQTERTKKRVFISEADGVLQVKDRTGCFPNGCEPDFEKIYEKYFLPRIAGGGMISQVAA